MAENYTPRMGVRLWTADGDTFTRDELHTSHQNIEARAAIFAEGTLALRPAPGVVGRFYVLNNSEPNFALRGQLYYDTGTQWIMVRHDLTAQFNSKAAASHTHSLSDIPVASSGETSSTKLVRADDNRLSSERIAGEIIMFGGSVTPSGWLPCNGANVSRTTYSRLFAAIGTSHGAGDGSTTFTLPDLRGRAPVGVGTPQGAIGATNHGLGQKSGAETHTITMNEMPNHNHGGATGNPSQTHTHSGTTSSDGAHSHTYLAPHNDPATGAYGQSEIYRHRISSTTSSTGVHTHTVTTGAESRGHTHSINAQGSGHAHNNMQPYSVVNFIIKV